MVPVAFWSVPSTLHLREEHGIQASALGVGWIPSHRTDATGLRNYSKDFVYSHFLTDVTLQHISYEEAPSCPRVWLGNFLYTFKHVLA